MRRRTLAIVVVACFGLLGGFASHAAAKQLFGFSTNPIGQQYRDEPSPAAEARLSAAAGGRVDRVFIPWKAVQPEGVNGQAAYSLWGHADEEVAAMRAEGIRPLILIADAPGWARPRLRCTFVHCPPDPLHLPDWAAFAGAVAARYPDAAGVEVWNSPNTKAWWSVKGGPDPKRYASVWSWAARAIHRAVPTMPVLFGSVGYAGGTDRSGSGMSIPTFLKGFYNNVDRRQLRPQDGLAVNAYPGSREIDRLRGQFAKTMRAARRVRDERDPGRKLWITETGYTTTGPWAVTPPNQARGLVNVLTELEASRDVAAIFVYTLVEPKQDNNHPAERGYGIVMRGAGDSLRPKKAYCAVAHHRGRSPAACPAQTPGGADVGRACTIRGTPKRDVLVGTRGGDVICGRGGRDVIRGKRGADVIRGGRRGDVLRGGRGPDVLGGGRGHDRLRGGRGRDIVGGGRGPDRLHGGPGRDILRGGRGRDLFFR